MAKRNRITFYRQHHNHERELLEKRAVVTLRSTDGKLVVARVEIRPQVSWPQSFSWQGRLFVRRNWQQVCLMTEPPDYYEIAVVLIVEQGSEHERKLNAITGQNNDEGSPEDRTN